MQELVVVVAEAARAKLSLHLAEPLVFAALDFDEFGNALDSQIRGPLQNRACPCAMVGAA